MHQASARQGSLYKTTIEVFILLKISVPFTFDKILIHFLHLRTW